ncbi:MAG TPA: DUF4149 domain-containing protein [Tepidisphaeraceae bacterium]|jgi:hypothetical protein|nr:DUF4149 domain-containing protein [Tepidisphaeraceae bacterium]
MDPGYMLIQFLYWLALATWFGGVFFVTIAAPIIFKTIRESDPTLPTVLSVNLEGQHGTLLAGSIVANLLATMMRIQLICAVMLVVAFVGQWIILFHAQFGLLLLRTALFVIAVVLLGYDWQVIAPRIYKYREEYIDHADEPELANPAKEQFDRYHRESITVLMIELFALLGLVLFSAGISTAQSFNIGGH